MTGPATDGGVERKLSIESPGANLQLIDRLRNESGSNRLYGIHQHGSGRGGHPPNCGPVSFVQGPSPAGIEGRTGHRHTHISWVPKMSLNLGGQGPIDGAGE